MKKIFAMLVFTFAVLVMSATVFAGEMILSEDFDAGLNGWTLATDGAGSVTAEDGVLQLRANGATATQSAKKTIGTVTEDCVLEFKVKLGTAVNERGVSVAFYNGVRRAMMRIYANKFIINQNPSGVVAVATPHTVGVWYTYYVVVTNGGTIADIYRKAEGDAAMTTIAENVDLQINGAAGAVQAFIEGEGTMSGSVDYIRVYTNGFYITGRDFYSEGAAVTEIPNGTLTAKCDVQYMGTDGAAAVFILIVFDGEGMIQEMKTAEREFSDFASEGIELTVDLSQIYEQVKNGSAELYVWDSIEGMQPLCSMISI